MSEAMLPESPGQSAPAFRVRPALAGELPRIQGWLPQAFWGSPPPDLFAARQASGVMAGAASLRLLPDRSGQLQGQFLLFVEPGQRRRGCGTCLLQALQTAAHRRGARRLVSEQFVEDSDSSTAFFRAGGLTVSGEKRRYRIDLTPTFDFLTARYRQLEQAGAIPAEARIDPLEQADYRAVAAFLTEHLGGLPEQTLAQLQASPPVYDRQMSTVIHLEQRLVGVELVRLHQNVGIVEAKAVAPDQRRGWVNVALMFRCTREGLGRGLQTCELEAVVGEHDNTVKLAQQLQGVQVGRSLSFSLDLAAAPPAAAEPSRAVATPEVVVTGDLGPALEMLRIQHSPSFPQILDELGVTLVVTTGATGHLLLLRSDNGSLNVHVRTFDQAQGLGVDGDRLALATELEIWEYHNAPAVAARLLPPSRHDACYLPRGSHVTGNLWIHDMAWIDSSPLAPEEKGIAPPSPLAPGGRGAAPPSPLAPWGRGVGGEGEPELWFVNTRFSCLCTRDPGCSFVPRWRPPFISAVVPQDRCHLTGLALDQGRPRFVTAWAVSDEPGGWRLQQRAGGVLLDVPSGEVVARGLSLPQSPRCHRGQLWLLNSGAGGLGVVNSQTGGYEEVAALPGFPRGLDFGGGHAFVGLSQVPESTEFSGLASAERCCGVWVVDLVTGQVAAFVHFTGALQEIFAVAVLPGRRFPDLINGHDGTRRLADSFVLPDAPLDTVPAGYVQLSARRQEGSPG